jgi:uncharacterized protein YqeY
MIIKSILDTDLYKFTTSYAYMKLFPQARGTFEFIDRDNTEYPEDFIERLYLELGSLGMLHLTKDEQEYMNNNCRFIPPVYWEWLSSFKFNSGKIQASLDENSHLHIKVTDYLYKVTLYEVPILAIVSELRSRIFDNNCDLADFIKTNTVIGITDEDARHIINILNRNDMWNDKLNAMIADSMKKHDTTRTNVYRAIKTAFTNYAAAKNAKPLDEAAEISIIKKMRDERWANAETYQTAGRMDLSAAEADEAEILEELLPKEPTKEELNAALLKLALDKGWYDDNEEHNIHPVQIPKNQMGIAVKELKAKYPAADGKKIADLVKANLCN